MRISGAMVANAFVLSRLKPARRKWHDREHNTGCAFSALHKAYEMDGWHDRFLQGVTGQDAYASDFILGWDGGKTDNTRSAGYKDGESAWLTCSALTK